MRYISLGAVSGVVWYNLWFIHTYVICLQYYYVSFHQSPFSPYENADNVKIATDILIVNLQSWKTREQGTRCWNLVHAIFFVVVRCDEILENIMQEKHHENKNKANLFVQPCAILNHILIKLLFCHACLYSVSWRFKLDNMNKFCRLLASCYTFWPFPWFIVLYAPVH